SFKKYLNALLRNQSSYLNHLLLLLSWLKRSARLEDKRRIPVSIASQTLQNTRRKGKVPVRAWRPNPKDLPKKIVQSSFRGNISVRQFLSRKRAGRVARGILE